MWRKHKIMWRKISQSDAKNNNNVIIRSKSRRKSFAIFKVDLAFFILAVHQLFHIWNCILILPTQETTFISLSEFIGNFPPLSRNTARSRRCYMIVVHTRLKMNGSTSIPYIYNIYVYENANALTAGIPSTGLHLAFLVLQLLVLFSRAGTSSRLTEKRCPVKTT